MSEKKHLQSRLLGMIVWAAFLRIVKTCQLRSAAKHCVQVRLTFKILEVAVTSYGRNKNHDVELKYSRTSPDIQFKEFSLTKQNNWT